MKKFFSFVAAAFVALTMNAQTISVADAITAGMALDSAATSEATYTIEGYVVNAQPFSLSYGNQIWYMADDAANANNQEFQAYGCVVISNNDTMQVLNGDKVQLTGKLFKYYNKSAAKYVIEVKNGTAAFVTMADGDHTIDKGVEQLTVAQALAIGNDLAIGATSTKTYEITGYVTALAGKDTDFEQYGNQTYWIADAQGTAASNADGAFEVYRGVADQAVAVGYKVKVKTAIKKYNDGSATGLIESETKAAVTILEGGDITPVEQADVVFDKDDFAGQGQAATQTTPGGAVSATKSGVTFTCDNAYGDGQYGVRCYQGANVSITSAEQQIGKIVFEFATVNGKYYNGGLDEEIVVNGMEWSATGLASQARMNKIKIYFGEYEQPVVDTLTAAEALAAAQALEVGATQKVVCKAYIANVKTPYNEEYGNITVFLTDDPTSTYGDIQAYRAKCSAEDGAAIAEHDLVLIEGNVTHTQNEAGTKDYYEFASGAQLKLLQKAEGIENITLTEKAQKVVVDGVMYIIRDNKLFTVQGTEVR